MAWFRRKKTELPAEETSQAQPVAPDPSAAVQPGVPDPSVAPPPVLPDPTMAVSTRGLTKRFGDFTAVESIDLDVRRGEIFGFLGPNGSGKTTTIRMLCGVIAASEGQASVLGCDVSTEPELVRQRIGYMSQKFSLFEDLTVDENLKFYAGVYGVDPERFAARRAYVLEMADLVGRERELTANLSVGWKQRLALGCATIHEPELIFLDEPTSGVDPTARRHFWDLLYELAAGGVTLFVTTHYMDEATHCSQLAFIYDGKIIASGTPAMIRDRLELDHILEVDVGDVEQAMELLGSSGIADEVYLSGASLHVNVGARADGAESVASHLRAAGLGVARIDRVQATLEDVFVHLVTEQRALAAEPPPAQQTPPVVPVAGTPPTSFADLADPVEEPGESQQ